MKFKEKMKIFLFVIFYFTISYLLCSTHELPATSGYITRRKRFCSTPFYIFIIVALIVVFIFN